MTREEKQLAVSELSALLKRAPEVPDLMLVATWMFEIKKFFSTYMPHNNLPEVIAAQIYDIDYGHNVICFRQQFKRNVNSAKELLRISLADIKASIDIVE